MHQRERLGSGLAGMTAAMLFLIIANAKPLAAQLSGAIYTTDSTATLVNGNIYDTKEDVYLNGGPPPKAPCSAGGLPDGEYYFQVTDPSGSALLSTDSISDRRVLISGGIIVASLGPHLTGSGKCAGAVSVQLMPYADTLNPGGEYKVWITPVSAYPSSSPANSFGFDPSHSKTDNFKVRNGSGNGLPDPAITGFKFYDLNTNGILDPSEVGIQGWKIQSDLATISSNPTFTSATGAYSFMVNLNTGPYTISEVPPPPGFYPAPGAVWINTTPISGTISVGTIDVAGPNFGNVCLGAGGGLTLGFWSNKNGKAILQAHDPAWRTLLNGLSLRNASGGVFTISTIASFTTAFSGFQSWLLGATATNMAYMLSAQLAAMDLNVAFGGVNGNSLVLAGAVPGGCSIPGVTAGGLIKVSDLMADAISELSAAGLTPAGNPERVCQEFKKNALDRANNNITFVQPGPSSCPFTSPY